jgi:hypothetical protein
VIELRLPRILASELLPLGCLLVAVPPIPLIQSKRNIARF